MRQVRGVLMAAVVEVQRARLMKNMVRSITGLRAMEDMEPGVGVVPVLVLVAAAEKVGVLDRRVGLRHICARILA